MENKTVDIKSILDIFTRLSEYLDEKETKKRADKISPEDGDLLMVKLHLAKKDDESQTHYRSNDVLNVVPLIGGNTMDLVASGFSKGEFKRLTEPKKRCNAVAAIVIGHDYDAFMSYVKGSTTKRNPEGVYKDKTEDRIENARTTLIPSFEKLANEFLSKEKINGRPLKLEVVNSKWEQVYATDDYSRPYINDRSFSFQGREKPYFPTYAMPLAVCVSYEK